MTAHVFIVDDKTFPVHLQHRFAGTGASGKNFIDFNNSSGKDLYHHTGENLLVKMMADVSRIRKNDRVLFYLQSKSGQEGRFFGIFRASENSAFLDNDDKNQYLLQELNKSLTFRVLFEPEEVYPKGITEWHALDEIRSLEKPCQMLWSLIYRKLKGNRGCTMITSYEEDRICDLIRRGQDPIKMPASLYFDNKKREIISSNKDLPSYSGAKTPFCLLPRITTKHNARQQYESHLQAEIVNNIGRQNDQLSKILLGENRLIWLGNEVGCGVGMQSMDILLAYDNRCHHIMPIELKSVPAATIHINQIKRYVDWIEQYYIPNRPAIIEPILITPKNANLPDDFVTAVKEFNCATANRTCKPLRLIEFEIKNTINYTHRSIF